MKTKASAQALVFLKKTGLELFQPPAAVILKMDYPPGAVKDLEIRNPDELAKTIANFVGQNKIPPSPVVILLDDSVSFKNDLEGNCDQKTDEIEKFTESVPFEYVRSKNFRMGKGCLVIAVNREFYEYFQTAFEKNGLTTLAIAPIAPLGVAVPSAGLSVPIAQQLLSRIETIKQNSFYLPVGSEEDNNPSRIVPENKSKLYIMLGVFGLLLLALTATIVVARPFAQSKPKRTVPSAVDAGTSPAPLVEITGIAPSASPEAALDLNAVKIQILNGSRTPGQAELVKSRLKKIGFSQIATANAPAPATKTIITYLSSVSPLVLDKIVGEVKQLFTDVSAVRSPKQNSDVIVTTGSPASAQIAP